MRMIAGVPEDVLVEHQAQVVKLKLQAYELAYSIARMTPAERKNTGFGSVEEVILDAASGIERLTVRLEKRYPA